MRAIGERQWKLRKGWAGGKVERFGDRGGSVAPAVTTGGGGGGVETAGRVEGGPLNGGGGVDTAGRVEGGPLKDGDLSLGFGYAPRVSVSLSDAAVPPGSHGGLWGRPTAYTFHHRDAGAALGVGLAGTQHENFRDILSRREDFGSSAYAQQQHQQQHQLQQHHQQQQQQQQQHQHHHQHQHQHQHQQGLQGVQRPLNIAVEGPNYGDAGRGEAESSSSGSVDKGGHQQPPPGGPAAAGVEPWAARALREEVVVRGMDVQPLNESRQAATQHNPQQTVLNVEPVQQVPPAPPPQVVGSVGSTACQECGNQAKKDCSFQRCRTCCKSRDFECATHVKSTWVPASKRRERQAAEAAAAAAGQPRLKSKRARGLALAAPTAGATTSMTTTSANSPRGSDINSGRPSHPAQTRAGLPPEVRAQALFKCVHLTGVDDGENEFAYQATVKIGGHIFKGVLYDQGLDVAQPAVTSNPSDLQLGAGGVRGSGGSALPSSSPLMDPSGMYAPSNSLLGSEDPRASPWFS